MGKLTKQHVMIIGSVLTVLVAVGIFFLLIRPKMDELTAATKLYDDNKVIADRRPLAEANRTQAEKDVQAARAKWAQYERQYMPDINISNLLRAMEQRWREQSVVLGPMVNAFLRSDRNVRVTSGALNIPAPPTDPNAVNTQLIELELGTVNVRGSFENVLSNSERWNRFRRLVRVDNLGLSGNSPNITGQYSLRMYIFTRGTAGQAVPQAAGGGGGGMGGPGGESGSGSGSGGP